MTNPEDRRQGTNLPPLFIDGYFSQRIRNGEEPKYGYPSNHVPDTTFDSMKVVTGFMASRKGK